jgi:hypothetical protein
MSLDSTFKAVYFGVKQKEFSNRHEPCEEVLGYKYFANCHRFFM